MKRGFTKAETLTIVSIIIILVSIFVPAINTVREQQKRDKLAQEAHVSMVSEHIKTTKFPSGKAPGVITEAWFDDTDGHVLWMRAKDGDLIAVPGGKAMELLKKLIRRGRNP